MSIRRYTGRSRSRRSNPSRRRRRNPTPLKPKQFKKRMAQLEKLGLDPEIKQELEDLLPNADSSHSIYILDFWQARQALLKLVGPEPVAMGSQRIEVAEASEGEYGRAPEKLTPQIEGKLVDIIQKYAKKHFMHPYDCMLDAELQIDYYESLKHFIHLAEGNPYFSASWAPLSRITFVVPPERWQDEERHVWLGRIKGKTRLSNRMYGLVGYAHDHQNRKKAPQAIKLLRGAYSGDPIGAERQTEIPIELIWTNEKTMAPSDLIEYLTDVEENTVSAKFFVPEHHDPFITFDDGKSWVIIHPEDVVSEKNSLSDCGAGQFRSNSIILLSLREPIPGTSPQHYKALLKAEVVFPSRTIERDEYVDYHNLEGKVGIINQLRAHHNSKPGTSGGLAITDRSLHKYIIPLLEQSWIAHFSRPAHKSEDTFWPSDLTPKQREYLKEQNEYLLNTQKFYERFQELDYPHSIKNKLLDGLEFPMSHVLESLAELTPGMLQGRHSEGIAERMVRTSLERAARAKEQGDISDELLSLMDAAEQRILGIERRGLEGPDIRSEPAGSRVRDWLLGAGAEVSYPEIYRILKLTDDASYREREDMPSGGIHDEEGRWYPSGWTIAISSLAKKIERGDSDVVPLKRLGSKLLAAGFENGLIESGVTLNINQLKHTLENKLADAKLSRRQRIKRLRGTREQIIGAEIEEENEPGYAISTQVGRRPSKATDYSPSWDTILRSLRIISGSYMSHVEEILEMVTRPDYSPDTVVDAAIRELGDPWSNPYAKSLEPVAPLLRAVILAPGVWRKVYSSESLYKKTDPIFRWRKGARKLPSYIIKLPFSLDEDDIKEVLTGAIHKFVDANIPMYRAALVSLDRKLNATTLDDPIAANKSKKRLVSLAKKFLLVIKDKKLAEETSDIVELPIKDIIKVISAKRYNMVIRLTAIASLKRRINRGERKMRLNALFAVQQLLSRTKDKSLITDLLGIYKGHQSQYALLYFLAVERIEWLSENQEFFVEVLEAGLPKGSGWRGKTLPNKMYSLFRKLILEEPDDYLSLVVKLLFKIQFDETALVKVRRLIELALDKIIDNPRLLLGLSPTDVSSGEDLCDWMQDEHESGFPNKLKLTPKLLKQFRLLRNITLTIDDREAKVVDLTQSEIDRAKKYASMDPLSTIGERGTTAISQKGWDFIRNNRETANRRSHCFLDLAVTIAQAMDKSDRAKMYALMEPLFRRSLTRKSDYGPGPYKRMIDRLLD